MTEIPAHLRKRAEEARQRAKDKNIENQFERWTAGVPEHLAGVLRSRQDSFVHSEEQSSSGEIQKPMPSSIKELVARAQAAQDAAHHYTEILHQRESLHELITYLHGAYAGLVKQEELAESKLEESASLVAGWVEINRPTPPALPDFPDRLTDG